MNQQHETMLIITGAAGVLGRMLVEEAHKRDDSEQLRIMPMTRDQWDFRYGVDHMIFTSPGPKIVINCAGMVREEHKAYSPREMLIINGVLPHDLASILHNDRLVQISTDCVFNGQDGPYREDAQPTPEDFYGRSKLAGELTIPLYAQRNVLTIRLSFIGLGKRGLLRRFMYDKDPTVWGYDTWTWNGLYARTAARIILDWALNDSMTGLVHMEGPIITKYRLFEMLVQRFRPNLELREYSPPKKDMVLESNTCANDLYEPNWTAMMEELFIDWNERWSMGQDDWREDFDSAYYDSNPSRPQ